MTAIWGEGVGLHTGQTNKSLYNLGSSPVMKAEPLSRPRPQPEHGIYLSTLPSSPALCGPAESCLSLSGSSHCMAPRASTFALQPTQGSRSGFQSLTLVSAPSKPHGGQVLPVAKLPKLMWMGQVAGSPLE